MIDPAVNQHSPSALAVFLLVVLSLMWGTSFILIKKGLTVLTPETVAVLRISAASLLMLPVALTRLSQLRPKHFLKLLASGMMGILIPAFLFAVAQTRITSSVAGILNTLTPAFTMVVGVMFFRQRFRWISAAGLLLALGGSVMLMLAREDGRVEGINMYALLIVAACVLYGANLNFVKFKIADLHPLTITSVALMLLGPFALIYLFGFTSFLSTLNGNPGAWKATAYVVLLGIMSTAFATYLFYRLIQISTPLLASSVTYFMPVVAVLWGVLDNEVLYSGHFIGMAAILAGVYLANRK